MKLFIYDKFWDSLLKLNKTTQMRVTDFISKFRENSRSSAINLETINTFKDQTLRTARVDQKYRIVIKEVQASEVYLLVWVDNHDEAMSWAQNKRIDWNDETQAFQVFTMQEEELIEKASIDAPKLYMNKYSSKDLKRIGVPDILMPSVLNIAGIEGLDQLEEFLPSDVFENLFYLLDGAPLDNLITEIEEGLAIEENEKLLSKNNRRSFIELTNDAIFNEILQGSLQKWKYYLHPSQSVFVNNEFNGSVKLSGGAGTGKTVVALHRLKYLVANRRTEQPVLFTTFTKELTTNIASLAADLSINPNTYIVENIDALAFRLAKEYQLLTQTDKVFGLSSIKKPEELWTLIFEEVLTSFDQEFVQQEYEQIILEQGIYTQDEYLKASRIGRGKAISRRERVDLWQLIDLFNQRKAESSLFYKQEVYNLVASYLHKNELSLFSHIIVDELQDFSNIELRFIRSLTSEGKNDLFLVGDPFQNIYNKNVNFSKLGINIRGNRSRRLRINYRTTEEIKKQAFKVIQDETYKDFDGGIESKFGYVSLYHGIAPQYVTYDSKEEEQAMVREEINRLVIDGYLYNDIVIAARTRDALNIFRNHLHQQNIPYVDRNLLNSQNAGVRLTTFHGLKGLEFKQVFLVDVNNRTFPHLPYNYNTYSEEDQKKIIKTEKALFYVACSRAIERLVISGIGENSDLL